MEVCGENQVRSLGDAKGEALGKSPRLGAEGPAAESDDAAGLRSAFAAKATEPAEDAAAFAFAAEPAQRSHAAAGADLAAGQLLLGRRAGRVEKKQRVMHDGRRA